MDGAEALSRYTALDGALLGVFYMSYGVLGLIQLTSLFEGRRLRFALVLAGAAAIAAGLGLLDAEAMCGESRSALICNHGGRGLVALATTWTWVSLAMLALFALSKGLSRLSGR